jgi:hypothetical protein
MVDNASTVVTIDLIYEITVIVGPILATIIGIDVIITATTAAMTDATTTVAMTDVMTAIIGMTTIGVIIAMIAMMIVPTTDMITDVARMTIITKTAIGKSEHLRHCPKGQPQWCIPEGQP